MLYIKKITENTLKVKSFCIPGTTSTRFSSQSDNEAYSNLQKCKVSFPCCPQILTEIYSCILWKNVSKTAS